MKRYDLIFALTFLALALPRRPLFYPFAFAFPIILLFFLFINGKVKISKSALLFVGGAIISSLLNAFRVDFAFQSFVLALVSFSGLMWLFVNSELKPVEVHLFFKWFTRYVWFEALLGFFQFINSLLTASFHFDVVQGTFGLGGQRLLAVVFVAGSYYYFNRFLFLKNNKDLIKTILLFVMSILTFSFLILFSALLALVIIIVIEQETIIVTFLKKLKTFLVLMFILFVAAFFFTKTHVRLFHYLETAQSFGYPRLVLTLDVMYRLPLDVPYQPLIGIGMGQFSSWASAVLNPYYQSAKIVGRHADHFLFSASNGLAAKYIYERFWGDQPWPLLDSLFGHPLYSWLSIYTEIGLIAILIIIWRFRFLLQSLKTKVYYAYYTRAKIYPQYGKFALIFVVFLWFLDNFAEYPWVTIVLITTAVLSAGDIQNIDIQKMK